MGKTINEARRVCEDWLREGIRYNEESGILPTENVVARRLLADGGVLETFYGEIYPALNQDGIAWKHVLGCVLTTGAFWSQERVEGYRAGRKELEDLNQKIAKHSQALADMLERRDELHNHSGFSGNTHYHVCEVIDVANTNNGHYQSYLKKPLAELSGRYDLKYWPSLARFIRTIGVDASRAKTSATDPLTEAATKSSRPSKADFLRALLASIDENRGNWVGAIPVSFELSNAALADLLNILLELSTDEMVGEDYVKTQRHRYRASQIEA